MKTHQFFLVSLLILANPIVNGQILPQWVRVYGGAPLINYMVNDMVTDKKGNVFINGYGADTSYQTFGVTLKYNSPFGVQEWVQIQNGMGAYSKIAIDDSGNCYVTGRALGYSSSYDFLTIKYNSSGDTQWTALYNYGGNNMDVPRAIAVDDSLNVYVAGEEKVNFDADIVVIKYNSSGVQQWIAKYSTPEGESAYAIAVDSIHNIYIAGAGAFLTIKYNSQGIEQWKKESYGVAKFVKIQNNNSIYVGGTTNGDYRVINYDSAGNQLWSSVYDSGGTKVLRDMKIDNNGNIFLTGTQYWGSGFYDDYVTVKFSSNGIFQWSKSYNGGNGWDDAYSLAVDPFGNVFVTGTSTDSSYWGHKIITTIIYDSSGNTLNILKYTQAFYNSYYISFIGLDSLSNIYISGVSINSNSEDIITIKYDKTVDINNPQKTEKDIIIISPNPFSSSFTIRSFSEGWPSFSLYDFTGKQILLSPLRPSSPSHLQPGIHTVTFSTSHLPPGLYFLIANINGQIETMKIIKM